MVDKFEKKEQCLYCEQPMEAKNRNKRFCSDKCRTYWNRENNSATKIQDLTTPTNVVRSIVQPTANFQINTKRIAELEAEIPTLPENTTLGKRRIAWIRKEIIKLKYPNQ